jgi:hypothetical protein
MPASGKPITGKRGTITLANESGATPTFSIAAEVQDFKLSEEAAEVTGDRLSGPSFVETDDPMWKGEFVLYASKSDSGVVLGFRTGDRIMMTGNFGGNTAVGHVRITGRGEISVAKGNFITCPIKWTENDDAFDVDIKVITIA